ncbi:MAG: hypothetical protein ACOCV4_00665 [Myxococcota bacterium]
MRFRARDGLRGSSARVLLCVAMGWGAVLAGCDADEDEPAASVSAPAPEPRPVPVGPRPVASRAAFDLAVRAAGAVLVWGEPAQRGGGVRALALDGQGVVRGPERDVLAAGEPQGRGSRVAELAASAGGGRLGVAWVLRDLDGELRVRATHGNDAATTFAPAVKLGKSETGSFDGRGRVAVAVSKSGLVDVLYRSGAGPCRAGQRDAQCARFAHWQPKGAGRGLPLMVPEPCAPGVVGSLFREARWYFGVCSEGATTVYAIQFDPEYAHAENVLAACTPEALVPGPEGVLALGRCDGDLRAVELREGGKQRTDVGSVERRAACEEGKPVLTMVGAGQRARELRLTGPLGALEAWLPEAVAPPEARAVWTGRALLVATPIASEVALRRFECDGAQLIRTDRR